MDDQEYLQPGFDPNALRVPDLRRILLEHDVDYPSAAKKAQLIDIFNEHVAPKAARIQRDRAKVQASSRGMIDAGSAQDPATTGTSYPATTPKRARSVGRRRTRGPETPTDDDEDEPPRTTTKKTPGRRASSRPRMVDGEDALPASVRKTRKSVGRQSVIPPDAGLLKKEEEFDDDPTKGIDSPAFSSYNPFQSGSSPALVSPGGDRRKTLPERSPRKRSVSGARRKTSVRPQDEPEYKMFDARNDYIPIAPKPRRESPRRRTLRQPSPDPIIKQEYSDGDMLQPGEEFVPEEAAEVAQEPGPVALRRNQGAVATRTNKSVIWIPILAMLVAYFQWWKQQKIDVGFCGVGTFGFDDLDENENSWIKLFRPECEPCPPHADCLPELNIECADDYVETPHPWSFNGLIPLPPSCEPDTEKAFKINVMAEEAIGVLRDHSAKDRCKQNFIRGDFDVPEDISEADLRQVLYDRKSTLLSDREFTELWRNALEDVSNRDEVVKRTDENGTLLLHSTSLAALPVRCAIRLTVIGSLARHRNGLIGLILTFLSSLYARSKIASNRTYKAQVSKLVHTSLSHLSRQAAEHPGTGIAVAHLRDQTLQHEFDPVKRRKLWEGVEKVVEMNSNVRAGEREVEGEIMRVWTWIGGKFIGAPQYEDEQGRDRSGLEVESEWSEYPRVVV